MKITVLPIAGQTPPPGKPPSQVDKCRPSHAQGMDRVTLSSRRSPGHVTLDHDQLGRLWQAQEADDRLLLTRAQVLLHPAVGIKAQANLDPGEAARLLLTPH